METHINVPLRALSRTITGREAPLGVGTEYAVVRRTRTTIESVVALDTAMAAAKAVYPPLEPEALRARVKPAFDQLMLRLQGLRQTVEAEREAANEIEDFLNVPAPAETMAQITLDVEARTWAATADLGPVRAAWARGDELELLARLARGPMPSPLRQQARELFAAYQRQAHTGKVEQMERHREVAGWAQSFVDQIERVAEFNSNDLPVPIQFETA